MTKLILCLAALACFAGCTDAEKSQWETYGSPAGITCYSGGKVIYQGKSSGKIHSEAQSDGWYFREADTGHLIRLSGDCVIVN